MPTLYLDFENGNDDYAGTSFALLASGTDGAISSNVFSSSSASFPNDGSLIGQYIAIPAMTPPIYRINSYVSSTSLGISQINGAAVGNSATPNKQYYIGGRWKNITTGATAVRTIPGDIIRIMGSPAPTSLGQNGVWTSQALQAVKTVQAAANTTPISITCNAHGYSTGDTVVITSIANNTNANGTWEITVTGTNTFTLDGSAGNGTFSGAGGARLRNNTRLKLASAVTQNIASTGPGRAAWTSAGGANVVTTLNITDFKEHNASDSIAIAAAFTTGLAAYWPTGTIDLSGYQQVSFWIRQTTGTIGAAGAVDLRLCSDAAGVTAVNTINIPSLATTGRWMPVTVDLGTALGSSIQSIALYVNTDNGAQTFLLSNIIACKASSAADSLTLTSLIGKNTTGETWWGIQSINGTRVMLDADTNATPISTTVRGYYGTSETVTTWKRETIKLGPAAASTTALQTIQESGTDGNPITYSGGWDRTAMSTQNLETWLNGVNGNGYGIAENQSYINLDTMALVRLNRGLSSTNGNGCIYAFKAANNNGTGLFFQGRMSIAIDNAVANSSVGLTSNEPLSMRPQSITLNHCCHSNGSNGIALVYCANGTTIAAGSSSALIANNGTNGATANLFCNLKNITFRDNGTRGLAFADNAVSNTAYKCVFDDATEVAGPGAGGVVSSQNHDNTADNHKIFIDGGLISSATDQRNTASGISWKIQPTSTNRSANYPVVFSLAKVACAANSLVTIKAWMRRDNSDLTMRLACKGGQIAGVASDVTASVTTTNVWEEETITFTPTEVGVVEITAEAWGGTTFSGWVDDMTISQA